MTHPTNQPPTQPSIQPTNQPSIHLTNHAPIVSIGDLVADFIVAIPSLPAQAGQHQVAQEIRLEPGGGANFLIAGARLGYPMAAVGVLGDDEWGHQVAMQLQLEGINLAGVTHSGSTTTVIVLVSRAGEHVFLGQYGQGPRVLLNSAAQNLVQQAGALFCAGYTLREERLIGVTLAALAQAKQAGVPVYFDPGPQMADVSAEVRTRVLSLVDVLLTTEEELDLLTPEPGAAGLRALGIPTVVVKRGANGCAVYTADQPEPAVDLPGHPVPVVDTAAAGDSFNAGFMVGRLRGWPLPHCAQLANAVGAAKVQNLGSGRSVPTLAQVQAVIQKFQLDVPPLQTSV